MVAHANRGSALEALITMANNAYRVRKAGLIHKVPTAWVPLRGPDGKIVSAKVEEKAAVDFLGHIRIGKVLTPLAFDAKETQQDKWPLARLERHQFDYLADAHATGAYAFLLIGFMARDRFFILPFPDLRDRWETWKRHGRPAAVKIDDPALIEVRFPEYLKWLERRSDLLCSGSPARGG